MKKITILVLIITTFVFVACSNGKGTTIPDKEKMESNLLKSGYTVELYDFIKINDMDLSVDYLVANKGDEFIRICFNTTADNSEKIYNYFSKDKNVNKLVKMDDKKIVFCARDSQAMIDAGIEIVDVKVDVNVKVK